MKEIFKFLMEIITKNSKSNKIIIKKTTDSTVIVDASTTNNIYVNENEHNILGLTREIEKKGLTIKEKNKLKVGLEYKQGLIKRKYHDPENPIEDFQNYYFDDGQTGFTLDNIISSHSKIILLGNPGLGKSTELDQLTISVLENIENKYIPIKKDMRNFTSQDTLDTYIIGDWKKYKYILFIFDGIDEISNIQDFTSKLESFISKNENTDEDFKYLLSCRTNIYENIVKTINGFKKIYLQDLTYNQGIQLLREKCGNIIDNLKYTNTVLEFLKNPFQVSVLSNYITIHKTIPKNTADLWGTYIEVRLHHDKNDKLIKISLDTDLVKKYSKKSSLINELMKTSFFNENQQYAILLENSNTLNEFRKNPLITKQVNEDVYFFEHKNIQEYFAAITISTLSIEKIKQFILIPTTSKTHQSLFNTITFLINLIDDEKYNIIVDWFIDNEPEMLLKADSDKITSDIRIKVFQKYFKTECIDKTFWISTNKTFTENEIATFGDCEENYTYLINIIKENELHFRIIISALRLIKHFNLTIDKSKNLKHDFIKLLKSNKVDIRIKCQIIECIEYLGFCKNDAEYQTNIFEIFKKESSKELNRRLLSLLSNYENIDEYFDYIKVEFLRENEIIQRKIHDEVRRGNGWILESLILRLKNADNFISIVNYYFKNQYNVELSSEFAINLKNSILNFIKLAPNIIIKLFQQINNKTSHFKQERLLKSIITESGTQNEVIKHLLHNNSFTETHFFIAHFITKDGLNLIIEKYLQKTDESIPQNIEYFRNVIANTNNRSIAGELNDLMLTNGFIFRDKFLDDSEQEKKQQDLQNKPQINFDKLFRKDELIKEIETIFTLNEGIINREKIENIEKNWYAKNGHGNSFVDTSILLIRNILYRIKEEDIQFEDFLKTLEDNFTIYDEIKNTINRDKNLSFKLIIRSEQKQKILEWCLNEIRKINFDNMIKLETVTSFKILSDYKIFKNILFFHKEFNFELPQDFLINSIQFYGMENSDDDAGLDNLLEKINNKELFDKRIISNIKSKKLFSISFNKHIEYAINNNLIEAFETIREYLLDYKNNYINDNAFEKYILLTKDYILLKELSFDIDNYICWVSIKLLTQHKKEKELCIQKSIAYLNQSNSKLFYSNALGILFHFNHPKAIENFYSLISEDITPYYNGTEYVNYTIENYELLEKIFIAIYVDQEEKFKFGNHFNFFNAYVANLSKNDDSYLKTQEVLLKLKKELETSNSDSGIFYINQQIDNSKNSYINSKSKPLSFEEALKKVEEIIK